MNTPITTETVGRMNRKKSQGSLKIVDSYLTAQGILHLTFEDDGGNQIDLDLDPMSQPEITPKAADTE